jgi:hypothetical protein
MNDTSRKEFIFASDFDQTLTFNDSGYVLAELVGIPTAEFERKSTGMARLNLVQQGGELAYLLLHDPEFKSRVRKEHLYEVGKRIRLKENIALLYQILESGIPGYHFDFYVLSAAPVEVIQSALEGIVPKDHIFGTEFLYKENGEIETITRATAGYGKVFVLDQLQTRRRWQLRRACNAAHQRSRRIYDCRFRSQARFPGRETHRAQHQRSGGLGANPRRYRRMGASAHPRVL